MMMMWKMRAALAAVTMYMLVLLILEDQVKADCVSPVPAMRILTSREGAGTSVFLFYGARNTSYWFTFEALVGYSWTFLGLHFTLLPSGDDWALKLKKPLRFLENSESYYRQIKVRRPDKYDPVESEGNVFRVGEDDDLAEPVVRTATLFKNSDFRGDAIVKYYSPAPYNGTLPDGGQVFKVDNQSIVHRLRSLDYDKGDKLFGFAVRGHDFSGRQATKYLEIHVINVNDNPPVFINMGCINNCNNSHYLAKIASNYVGPITSYMFGPIRAVDADGDDIEYLLEQGSHVNYNAYVRINLKMGSLIIIKPLELLRPAVSYVDIFIWARSVSNLTGSRTEPVDNETEASVHLMLVNSVILMATGGADRQQVEGHLCFLGALLTIGFTASL